MSKSYVIQWKSKINGRAGKGTKVFDLEEAARLAEELNREYPGIHHEPIEAGTSAEVNLPSEPVAAQEDRADELSEAVEQADSAAEVSQVTHSPDFAFSA